MRIPPDPVPPPPHHRPADACCSPPLRHRAPSLRSPGQTGHEESPAESYSQHTIFPRCRCAPRFCIVHRIRLYTTHQHKHTRACILCIHILTPIHIIYYTYMLRTRVQCVSSRPVPRVSATSAPRFPLLRYWHIAASLSSSASRRPNTVVHRRPRSAPTAARVLGRGDSSHARVRATNVYNRVLPDGHLFTRNCNYYYCCE